MGAYEDNLRHVAEPASPTERRKAVSVSIEDHTALWFTDVLREYAHYGDHEDDDQEGIAVAYASYIDTKVRDEGQSHVPLYAHTQLAAETLMDALYYHVPDDIEDRRDYPMVLFTEAEGSAAEAFSHYVDDPEAPDAPEESPQVAEIDGEETVVFDVEEARESYAMMEIERAESEALAEIEADANARGVNNRRTPRVNPRYNE